MLICVYVQLVNNVCTYFVYKGIKYSISKCFSTVGSFILYCHSAWTCDLRLLLIFISVGQVNAEKFSR